MMAMSGLALSTPPALRAEPAPATPEAIYQQLGSITRQLHDALHQLGLMPRLQQAAQGLPDARSRMTYIASKTAAAADRVLTLVERAKAEQAAVTACTRALAVALQDEVAPGAAGDALRRLVAEVESRAQVVDGHLTDIMLAQDFHDLTGQVMAKVVTLANDLEHDLLHLLLQGASAAGLDNAEPAGLAGPVLQAGPGADVVANQVEVDELLASLGF